MFKAFDDFDELMQVVADDRAPAGAAASAADRYPVRFVLVDDFPQCLRFSQAMQGRFQVTVCDASEWCDAAAPDAMLTRDVLARRVEEVVGGENDRVIVPFSEHVRFFGNGRGWGTFEAVLRTVKGIEASPKAQKRHQRVYIPLVGLAGRMGDFQDDNQATIWRLRAGDDVSPRRLILTDGSLHGVDVDVLKKRFTVANDVSSWLSLWSRPSEAGKGVVCTSRSIFANAGNADPDNAFSFCVCRGAYEFLADGLGLCFGAMRSCAGEDEYWGWLAERVDIADFCIDRFVNERFNVRDCRHPDTFFRLWLSRRDAHERWLLAKYYKSYAPADDFLGGLLGGLDVLPGNNLVEAVAACVPCRGESRLAARRRCLELASDAGVRLSDAAERRILVRLKALAESQGKVAAAKYLTGISDGEFGLAVQWVGEGEVELWQVRTFWPDLWHYMSAVSAQGMPDWVADYFDAYRAAKLRNEYTAAIAAKILRINGSDASFRAWYGGLKTTRTLLCGRDDIDVVYWVDGLGADWIPFVCSIVEGRQAEGLHLREVMVAAAHLPTTTGVNKPDLLALRGGELEKSGDLDALAHRAANKWPAVVVEEIRRVREAVEGILDRFCGKTIAIVSDHGLTWLAQMCDGLNLCGAEADHHGRAASRPQGGWAAPDANYVVLDDGSTACALRHASLCGKVPSGQGAHGGCTPEEVLVPVFIISGAAASWTAELLTPEVSGASPSLEFSIIGLPCGAAPVVEYGGRAYPLRGSGDDVFRCGPLTVNPAVDVVSVVLGGARKEFKVRISSGATEDDLFAGL